jgi:serine/threonine protein kinase
VEYINGRSLVSLDAETFTLDESLNIVGAAFKIDSDIHHEGVTHSDIAPRNILYSAPTPAYSCRVVVVDFNRSVIHRLAGRPRHKDDHILPISPITRQHPRCSPFSVISWFPESSDWLFRRWYGSAHYEPVPDRVLKLIVDCARRVEQASNQ